MSVYEGATMFMNTECYEGSATQSENEAGEGGGGQIIQSVVSMARELIFSFFKKFFNIYF